MRTHNRHYSRLDQFCMGLDQAIRAIAGNAVTTGRAYPASCVRESDLTAEERRRAASLMRVNHTGEVCAQALYHAQGLVSKKPAIQKQMQAAAIEEGDHLAWCSKRLQELDSHTSYLNPIWYVGSFAIGSVAGLISDKWSLGFVAETEDQVVKHLDSHLQLLPKNDEKSAKILQQMQIDEAEHRHDAIEAGAMPLPYWIKQCMRLTSKVMVKIAYCI